VHTDHRTLQPESIEKAHAKGLRVLVYTVNDPDRAESLLRSGVDAIVTDNLAEFARRFPDDSRLIGAEPPLSPRSSPKGEVDSREGAIMARYGKKAQSKVKRAMHERKRGTLKSGRSGKTVTSRKQAIAIGLSEARKAGAKVPKKKSASR
jgi:hypothetical protein